MMRIVWAPQAERDLRSIREYIAADSPRYADLTIERIFVAVERLAHFPLSGIIVPERNQADIREIIIGRFRVVCRVTPESIQIATIFRAARQIPGAAS